MFVPPCALVGAFHPGLANKNFASNRAPPFKDILLRARHPFLRIQVFHPDP